MKILDTLTGEKREFTPSNDPIRMYVCGVTPYAPAHVGHALSYIVFDVVRRFLQYIGYKVHHVQNFTDIDDKIIDRAQQKQVTVEALSEQHIQEYLGEMAELNVLPAHNYPRATQEIPSIISIISILIDKAYAYAVNGDVYFRVLKDPEYGKLSHRSLGGMRAGARVEPDRSKDHPMDFALWKAAKPGEPKWESPWGPGRPGWHIECTAMALSYLGDTIDIHGGGQDLVFPHHENEIAQSEASTGHRPFAQVWMHNGLLQLDQQKMSKSLDNLVTIRDALSEFSGDVMRLAVLSSHYRSPSSYSEVAMQSAARAIARLKQALVTAGGQNGRLDPELYKERFINAMNDDFNTPQALAVLFDLARDINRGAEDGLQVASAQSLLLELGQEVLGFTYEANEIQMPTELKSSILRLVSLRTELRAAGKFSEADQVRNDLAQLDVVLTDSPEGTSWRWNPQTSGR